MTGRGFVSRDVEVRFVVSSVSEGSSVRERLRGLHVEDRSALERWLASVADLEQAEVRYERARRRLPRPQARSRGHLGAVGRGDESGTVAAPPVALPLTAEAREHLVRSARADAATATVRQSQMRRLAAEDAVLSEARSTFITATRTLARQVPWAGMIMEVVESGSCRSQQTQVLRRTR